MNWFCSLTRTLRSRQQRRRNAALTRRTFLRLEELESRIVPYSVSGDAWPVPQLITISFVPDGTVVGTNSSGNVTSNLFATFNAKFGSASTWENIILQAAQSYAQQTNINFAVVPDNGSPIGSGPDQQGNPNMGDIRISGYNFGNSNLGLAYMPPPVNNYSLAGDVQFNTGQTFNDNGASYDLFTVAAHEIGHALGLNESSVISAEMYGSYQGVKSSLTTDDINGIRTIYSNGNPRSPDSNNTGGKSNGSFATATDITSSISSSTDTAVITGLNNTTTSQAEYYEINGTAPDSNGGKATISVQSKGLSLLAPSVTVYASNQTTVLGSASVSGDQGGTATVTVSGVGQGNPIYIKVAGANTTAFGTGDYALTVNTGTGANPTVPLPKTTVANGNPISGGGGQAVKISQEMLVNTTTANTQSVSSGDQRSVATDANGNSVVVWQSQGQDGSGWGVYAQRYDSNGNPIGGEFRVNTTTQGDQTNPSVAMDANGNFVVAWQSNNQDGSGWGIYAQRYNANGNPIGGEFRVNTTTQGDQINPSVAMDANGNFVIAWQSDNQDGSGWGIYARYYSNLLGLLPTVSSEFRVNTTTQGDQTNPSVAMDPNGDFVIAWQSNNQDGSGWGIYAQRYTTVLGLTLSGGEFRVNTTTQDDQTNPSVAMDAYGDFTVAWQSHNQDGSGWGIYAQRYSSLGLPVGGEFRVNTTTLNDQTTPSATMDAAGDLIVTWQSNNQDGSGWGVYGQQYARGGSSLGGEFQVATTTAGDQQYPAAVLDNVGYLIVVWSGNGIGDSSGVFMQRFNTLSNAETGDGVDVYNPLGEDGESQDTSDSDSISAAPLPATFPNVGITAPVSVAQVGGTVGSTFAAGLSPFIARVPNASYLPLSLAQVAPFIGNETGVGPAFLTGAWGFSAHTSPMFYSLSPGAGSLTSEAEGNDRAPVLFPREKKDDYRQEEAADNLRAVHLADAYFSDPSWIEAQENPEAVCATGEDGD